MFIGCTTGQHQDKGYWFTCARVLVAQVARAGIVVAHIARSRVVVAIVACSLVAIACRQSSSWSEWLVGGLAHDNVYTPHVRRYAVRLPYQPGSPCMRLYTTPQHALHPSKQDSQPQLEEPCPCPETYQCCSGQYCRCRCCPGRLAGRGWLPSAHTRSPVRKEFTKCFLKMTTCVQGWIRFQCCCQHSLFADPTSWFVRVRSPSTQVNPSSSISPRDDLTHFAPLGVKVVGRCMPRLRFE